MLAHIVSADVTVQYTLCCLTTLHSTFVFVFNRRSDPRRRRREFVE